MEDAHMICLDLGPNKDTNLFGIFDGHGGCEVALFVGHHFAEEFIKNENYLNNDIKTALESNYLKMDEMMLSESGRQELISECKKSKEENAKLRENTKNSQIEMLREVIDPKEQPDAKISMFTGTTACILCIKEKKLFFANAGDSRVVMCKNGNAEAKSIDHKPELQSEKDRIYKAEGWISDGRVMGNINLTRGFGDLEYKKNKNLKAEEQIVTANPEIQIVDFTKDVDFVIIGCDGIWDCLKNQDRQRLCMPLAPGLLLTTAPLSFHCNIRLRAL